jgi:hypothetical protein
MLINFGKFPRSSTHKNLKVASSIITIYFNADSHILGIYEEKGVSRRISLSYIFNG